MTAVTSQCEAHANSKNKFPLHLPIQGTILQVLGHSSICIASPPSRFLLSPPSFQDELVAIAAFLQVVNSNRASLQLPSSKPANEVVAAAIAAAAAR